MKKLTLVTLLLATLFGTQLLLNFIGGWDLAFVGTIAFILLGIKEVVFDW